MSTLAGSKLLELKKMSDRLLRVNLSYASITAAYTGYSSQRFLLWVFLDDWGGMLCRDYGEWVFRRGLGEAPTENGFDLEI